MKSRGWFVVRLELFEIVGYYSNLQGGSGVTEERAYIT
jgi:hypothetical protein